MLLEIGQTINELSLVGAQSVETVHQFAINPWVAALMMVGFLFFFLLVILPRLVDNTLGIGPGLAIFVLGVMISSLPLVINALGLQVPLDIKAGPSKTPRQLHITQLQSTSFTLSWQTEEAVLSALRFGSSKDLLDQAAFNQDPLKKTTQHLVAATDLRPGTTYYIEVISGGQRYNYQGQPIEILTLSR
jgi:hypothetical protein